MVLFVGFAFFLNMNVSASPQKLLSKLIKSPQENFNFEYNPGKKEARLSINVNGVNKALAAVGEIKVFHAGSRQGWAKPPYKMEIGGKRFTLSGKLRARYKPNKYFRETKTGDWKVSFLVLVENGSIVLKEGILHRFDINRCPDHLERPFKKRFEQDEIKGKEFRFPLKKIVIPGGKFFELKTIETKGNFTVLVLNHN
jgi:hypothetical protein